jgi:shikimate kinase
MGTRKAAVGERLAALTGADVVDLDGEIAKLEVMSVTEIFAEKGEVYFRGVEHRLLCEVREGSGQVVALGGGAVCSEGNRNVLERKGPFVPLTAALAGLPKDTGACPRFSSPFVKGGLRGI